MVKELEDKTVYLIGSLKNRRGVIPLAKKLRDLGFREVFDDWIAPGPEADDYWRDLEKKRERTYGEALKGWAGTHVFEFDSFHIERSDIGVLAMPAGKSGHLEFGEILGTGKRGYIFFDKEPKRWDVMYQFADGIFFNYEDLEKELITNAWKPTERDSFGNIFQWFTQLHNEGMPVDKAKEFVRKKVDKMMDNYRRCERVALQSQYESAIALLK